MTTTIAEAEVRVEGKNAIVELKGDINRAADAALTTAYDQVSRSGARNVLLNFAGTDFINSTGIAVIVGLLAKARQDGIGVTACGLTEHYQHIFQITRLADFMPMFPDESAALASVS
jgi:anti-anti-sigma factor